MPFLKTQRSTLALLCGLFLLAATAAQAQYMEQFNTAGRGYLLNCQDNFTGVSWTLSDWDPTGLCRISPPDPVTDLRDPEDYFHTTGGVLTGVDFDEQLCWISPTLTVPNSGVGFSVKIGWTQLDREDISNNASDYIDVEYSTNGGANWTRLPTTVGAGLSGHTVCYVNNNGGGPSSGPTNNNNPGNPSLSTFSASSISGGGTLIIRICAQFNQDAESITIDDVSVPLASAGGCVAPTLSTTFTNVSCNGGSTGTIDLTVSGGGTPPYTYAWTGGAATEDLMNLAVGTYTVTVTDNLMCSATTSATIGVAPAITRSTVVGDATCAAVADGGVDLTVSGGVPPYTYSWSNGAVTQDIDNVAPGTYTVVITDAPGCTSSTSATVGTVTAGPYNETFATAGKGYLPNFEDNFVGVSWSIDPWTVTDLGNSIIGREADDYYRTSGGALVGVDLDRNVCWNSPIIDINPPGSGVSFTVDFAWTSLDREDISNVASDFIDVEYSVDGGAWTRVPTTSPATGLSLHTICYRNNNGGGPSSAPTDNNGSLVLTVPGLSGSTLRIRACSQFNSEDESITINSVSVSAGTGVYCPAPESNAGNDEMVCGATGVTLAATASNGTGAWSVVSGPSTSNAQFSSTSAANATFTAVGGAGTYTLRWTVSANGFPDATDDVVITVKAKPSATITPNPSPVCQNTTLNLSVPDAGVGASYNWSGSGVVNTNANSTTAVPSATGSQPYAVTVTGANACSTVGSINVTVNARPSATITPNPNPVCQNSTLNLSVLNAGGGASYNWSGSGISNNNSNATTAVPTATGSQPYAVTVTDGNGCSATSSTNVTVNAQPSATITPNPNPVCQGSTLNLSVPNAGGSYNWSGSGIVNNNANTTTAMPIATGSQAYAVTVTGANGCTNTGTVNVTVNALPSATITPNPSPVCQNSTLNLSVPSAGVGASYNWSGNGIANNSANATTAVPTATGLQAYAVTVTNANGCSATGSTNVTVNAQPSAAITPNPSPVCQGSTLNLSVPNAGGSYNWSGSGIVNNNANTTTAVPIATGSQPYAVTVTGANGCTNTSSVNVTVNPQPSATITATQPNACGPALVNLSVPSAGGGASYNWSGNGVVNNNSNATTASPNSGGNQTYQVTVTNAQGCSNTGSTSVLINICIAGRIIWKTDNTSGVKDVTVTLSGDQSASVLTPLNGTYSFNFNSGSSFMITPSKNLNKMNGVNAQDVFRLQQHLSGGLLTDPYLLAAADVSANNMISALDVNIIQLALLGNPQALTQFLYSWRFVPTTHTMTNPPWGYPEKITIANAGSGLSNQDFYGIKVGDVTAINANPANASGNPMVLRVQDQFLKAGQTVSVDFTADQLADLTAFQLALRFDPSQLRLSDIQSLTALPLSKDNFGVQEDGLIRVLWAGTDAVALRAPSPVFRLTFTALQSGDKLSEVLGLDNSALPAHVYNSMDAESDLSLRFFEVTATNDPTLTQQDRLVLYQNQPNPFEHETLIGFYLPEAAKTAFTVYDVNGRLVYRQDINGNKGYNQLTLKDKTLLNAGLFYYRVETAMASATKKMVKVE